MPPAAVVVVSPAAVVLLGSAVVPFGSVFCGASVVDAGSVVAVPPPASIPLMLKFTTKVSPALKPPALDRSLSILFSCVLEPQLSRML